jgi:NADH-quinone oxidoreductase subunit I/NAD(P)H-quinone oxidoreductase subunit I
MGAATEYFGHIKQTLVTIFDGMAVTASHMIRRPYTIQYPDRMPVRVQDTLPFRYRGILDVDLEICTGCLACDRACPIDCIAIAIEKNAQTREIVISQFDIDLAKCMYCGLCSEPCPTGAIHHTTEFEGADYSLENLIRRFIAEPVVAYKPKKGPEPDAGVARLLERGMTYVDQWAQPGSDKPAKPPAAPPKPVAATAKPVAPSPTKPPVAAKTGARVPSPPPANAGDSNAAEESAPPHESTSPAVQAEAVVTNGSADDQSQAPALNPQATQKALQEKTGGSA